MPMRNSSPRRSFGVCTRRKSARAKGRLAPSHRLTRSPSSVYSLCHPHSAPYIPRLGISASNISWSVALRPG